MLKKFYAYMEKYYFKQNGLVQKDVWSKMMLL